MRINTKIHILHVKLGLVSKKELQIGKLIFAVFICEAAGILGSITTISSIKNWYQFLNKPVFNPPSWIFGPTWTILYLLMGISLYLIWVRKGKHLTFFWIQLALNAAWSNLFFGLHSPFLAFIDIIALLIAIIITIKIFYKIYVPAGLILLPYLLWVSFATILNLSILLLN